MKQKSDVRNSKRSMKTFNWDTTQFFHTNWSIVHASETFSFEIKNLAVGEITKSEVRYIFFIRYHTDATKNKPYSWNKYFPLESY